MPLTKTTITDTITRPDGTAPGSVLQFYLNAFDTDGQVITADIVEVTLDAAGTFSVALWPNGLGVRGTSYTVQMISVVNGRHVVIPYGSIVVENTGTAVFSELLGVTQAQLPTTNALAAQSAAAAAADALATAADRVQTGLDAAATAADRVQTGLDAASIAGDAVATAADRVQTGLDRTAAAASAVAAANAAVNTGSIKFSAQVIGSNLSVGAGFNGYSVGPIEIAAGVTMDVASGSVWAII